MTQALNSRIDKPPTKPTKEGTMAKKEKAVETQEVTEAPVKKEKAPTKAELAQKEADAVDFVDDIYFPKMNPDGTYIPLETEGLPTISRAAAMILGFRRYFTGEPCVNGHISPRKVKTSTCVACTREKLKARTARKRQEDPEFAAAAKEKAKARRLRKKAAKAETTA